jgi:HK97 family phage portal protein
MSMLYRRNQRAATITAQELIPQRMSGRPGIAAVTNDTALRHSAVWACLRLRANLISSMPVDVYRKVDGIQVDVPPPPILVKPGGSGGGDAIGIMEWLYSTQYDLDRGGNTFGIVTEKNALGLPARIDLVPLSEVTVIIRKGTLSEYRISGVRYDPDKIWHERQYTVAGLPVGLSPVAHAAWSISEYLSIQDFALDWFGNGGVPLAQLKNTAKTIDAADAAKVKERFKASVSSGDVFVSGADWEYQMIQADNTGSAWLEAKNYSIGDIARFFDCPGDLVDSVIQSGNVTYANITQRNLQFLTMHLGPAILRREAALSTLLPAPRYVKLNRDSLLAMDPKSRADYWMARINSRSITPDEIRAMENEAALTKPQIDQLLTFFPPRGTTVEPGAGLESVVTTAP